MVSGSGFPLHPELHSFGKTATGTLAGTNRTAAGRLYLEEQDPGPLLGGESHVLVVFQSCLAIGITTGLPS